MKTKKQIEKEIIKLRQEQNDIEEQEYQKIQVPFLKSLVGRCFVYKDNSYGSGGKWDVYKQVLETFTRKKDGNVFLITEEFSVNCDGKIVWEIDSRFPYTNEAWRLQIPFTGFVEVSKYKYEQEKLKMLEQMTSRSQIKKCLEKD